MTSSVGAEDHWGARGARRLTAVFSGCCLVGAGLAGTWGCNAFDDPVEGGFRNVRVVPTDERSIEHGEVTALPVSGGTLLSLSAGNVIAMSDPSRDRIKFTDGRELDELVFEAGSQPWRMTSIGATAFAVSLRGSGQVVAVQLGADDDLAAGDGPSELWRADVCTAPRGLDFEPETSSVHVACAGGELLRLDAQTGAELSRRQLDSDLRDVVVNQGRIYVSRFRAAEVLILTGNEPPRRAVLPTVTVHNTFAFTEAPPRTMKPAVAWRMQAFPGGGAAVVHQRADVDPVPIETASADSGRGAASSPYGGSGASLGCTSIVQSAISVVQGDGTLATSDSLVGVILPVDLAVSADGSQLLVANAGVQDVSAPVSTTTSIHSGDTLVPGLPPHAGRAVAGFDTSILRPVLVNETADVHCAIGTLLVEDEPASAVLFNGATPVVHQERANRMLMQGTDGAMHPIWLGGPSIRDTGHDIFHRDTGSGIACASCHPEGTDDGHVWVFEGLGPRRTQNLATPLAETAPYHWDGELSDVSTLMNDVFVERMGGVFQSEERMRKLEQWLFTAPQPVFVARANEAAERGRTLFESAEVGCASCHRGPALSDNTSHDVGTSEGVPLQTPSLVGLAAHPPFMHDGCAKTLEERFTPQCGGGDRHGRTSQLSETELSELSSYLHTL